MNGLVGDFTFAARLKGEAEPLSTLFYLPPNPNVVYSAALMSKAEEMFLTGKAPYPIERTLLTSGPRRGRHAVARRRAEAARDAAPGRPLPAAPRDPRSGNHKRTPTMKTPHLTRRAALKSFAAAGLVAAVRVPGPRAPRPSETLYHASFGASGMAAGRHPLAHGEQARQARRGGRRRPAEHGRGQEAVPRRQGLPGLARAARQGEGPRTRSTSPRPTTCTPRSPCGPCSAGCTSTPRSRSRRRSTRPGS